MPEDNGFCDPPGGSALDRLPEDGEESADLSLNSSVSSLSLHSAFRDLRPLRLGTSLEGRTLVGDRIRVGRRIGGGAMGVVYEAVCDGREMAIKVLNRLQELQVYRLKTEFRRLTQLNHPNVVCAYELFNEDQEWFFSMERVHGAPVHRYLEARFFAGTGDSYDAEFRSLLRQLIEAIAAIHGAGLVHRDLKPTNILVASDGRLVIVDFGLVSEQRAGGVGQTVDNHVSGTVGYIAPELQRGGRATPASDCYALGATMYHLLTGRPPRIPEPDKLRDGEPQVAFGPIAAALSDLAGLCARLLTVNPIARPSVQELLQICAKWATPTQRQPSPSGLPAEQFVGRENELAFIRQAYERARGGAASIVLVHGVSASGKSALLGKFVTEMQSEGVIVLEGRCSEWETVPYKGLDEVIDGLSRLVLKMPREQAAYLVPRHAAAVVRVFPALRRIDTFAEAADASPSDIDEQWLLRLRAVAGVKETLYRLAERHRVALVIDDLQWVDADTVHVLSDLLSPSVPPNHLFLVSSVTDSASTQQLLAELSRTTQVTPLTLGPLSPEDSRKLARTVLQERARDEPGLVERVVHASQGIPLYIAEFAHEFADLPDADLPVLLSQVLLARVERLDPTARRLLELVAVAARPLTMRVADLCNAEDVPSSLRQLIAHRLVCSVALVGQELGFKPYTEHVRHVVTGVLPDERVTEWHVQLVCALESLPDPEPEWLLAHYRGAGRYESAKRYSVLAAERALSVLAFERAANIYLDVLEFTNEHGPDWVDLNVSCADALGKAGRGAEAAQAFVRAARSAPHERRAALLNRAVTHWIRSGHIVEGVQLLRTTLEAAGISWPETPTQAILKLLSQRAAIRVRGLECAPRPEAEAPSDLLLKLDALNPAQTALGTFDYLRGATFAAIALPLALKAREPKRLVVALASEASYVAMLRGLAGERRMLGVQRQIDEVRQHGTGAYERAASCIARAMCAYWTGRWNDVLSPAAQAESVLRQHVPGALWELSLLRSIRHTVLLHSGRQHELAKELPDELTHASAQDDRYAYLDLLRRNISIQLARDDVAGALKSIEGLTEQRRQYPFLALDHLIMSSVVATHLYAGQVQTARRELDERWSHCCRAGMDRLPLVRLTVIGMQSDCIWADQTMPAQARARQLEGLARAAGKEAIAWAPALRSALLAASLEMAGNRTEASLGYRSAADEFAIAGIGAAAAAAEWRLARSLKPLSTIGPESDHRLSPGRGESFFRNAGLTRPDRWLGIVHSLY